LWSSCCTVDVDAGASHRALNAPTTSHPQEIGILKSISYDRNIVQFYGATMVGTEPMLLLEYCEGGDLRCGAPAWLHPSQQWTGSPPCCEAQRGWTESQLPNHTPVVASIDALSMLSERLHGLISWVLLSGRGALAADNAEADIDGERQLGWYASGHRIALDVARGLSFLHGINVRLATAPLTQQSLFDLGCWTFSRLCACSCAPTFVSIGRWQH
jgi:serine/threonine protein kinase